jgi:hypothetical protein
LVHLIAAVRAAVGETEGRLRLVTADAAAAAGAA